MKFEMEISEAIEIIRKHLITKLEGCDLTILDDPEIVKILATCFLAVEIKEGKHD